MSPNEINKSHGKTVWKCNTCAKSENLEWWNGLSVAVCENSLECHKGEIEKYSREMQAEADYQRYCDENW